MTKIHIPGKIFLSGEYAAIQGYPALLVAVNPGFDFHLGSQGAESFHPDSPAGKLQKSKSQNVAGFIHDPYKGTGGLGKSTAEYLAVQTVLNENQNIWETWKDYRELSSGSVNVPSGADLLTQKLGGYCVTETQTEKLQSHTWSFSEIDWVALVTGNKVKTHEHLAHPLPIDWHNVQVLNENIVKAFEAHDEENFVSGLNQWRKFLLENHLEVPETTELVNYFLEVPGVVAAKGCGALGSDIVLVIFEKSKSQILDKVLERWNANQIIRSSQVCYEGLKVIHDHEIFGSL